MSARVEIVNEPRAWVKAVLELVLHAAQDAVAQRGRFTVALAGGGTPKPVYEALAARGDFPFEPTHFFFGDERCVPPAHADSNYRMANEALFSRAPVPRGNIHRIEAERPADDAAREYEEELRGFFGETPGPPGLDLVLLGMGSDGHTASLFPGSSVLQEQRHWVAAPYVEKLKDRRVTLTPSVINAARTVVFLVRGADKAEALRRVVEGPATVAEVPARIIQPRLGRLCWFVDEAAASKLTQTRP
jgi:6-phosphogluconolactonase